MVNKQTIINLTILILCLTIGGIISIIFGFDRSYDVLNYHIYNPYAFLNNRITYDLMPANIQSFFNPLPDIPYYLAIKYLNNHPYLITFLQGWYYGIYIFIAYKINELLFKNLEKYKILSIASAFLITATAAFSVYEIGANTNDLLPGIGISLSVYILLKYLFDKDSTKRLLFILLAGLITGATTGLKLTAGLFAVSIFICCICLFKRINSPIKSLLLLGIGIGAGFLITNGYWMYIVYSNYQNPFFPYFNNIFKSPYATLHPVLNADFIELYPKTIVHYIFFPFYTAFGYERPYQDFRYEAMYIALICIILIHIMPMTRFLIKESEKYISVDKVLFLILFSSISYILWIKAFAQVRYLSPLISVCGGIIIITLFFIKNFFSDTNKRLSFYKFGIIFITLLLLIGTIYPYTRRSYMSDKLFYVEDGKIEDDAVVFSPESSSAAIIFQNPKARYIFMYNQRMIEADEEIISSKMIEKIRDISTKTDNVYVIYLNSYISSDMADTINKNLKKYFGETNTQNTIYSTLLNNSKSCRYLKTNITDKYTGKTLTYILCKIKIKN